MTGPRDTSLVPELVAQWAADVAGDGGEEREHTLYFTDEIDTGDFTETWSELDDEGVPIVGIIDHQHEPRAEWIRIFSPDQALELAAHLIIHAIDARTQAVESAHRPVPSPIVSLRRRPGSRSATRYERGATTGVSGVVALSASWTDRGPDGPTYDVLDWSCRWDDATNLIVCCRRCASEPPAEFAPGPSHPSDNWLARQLGKSQGGRAIRDEARERCNDRCERCGRALVWTDRRSQFAGTYDLVDESLPWDAPSTPSNVLVSCRGCVREAGPVKPLSLPPFYVFRETP